MLRRARSVSVTRCRVVEGRARQLHDRIAVGVAVPEGAFDLAVLTQQHAQSEPLQQFVVLQLHSQTFDVGFVQSMVAVPTQGFDVDRVVQFP